MNASEAKATADAAITTRVLHAIEQFARCGHKMVEIGSEHGGSFLHLSSDNPLRYMNPVLPTATLQELCRLGYTVSSGGGWFPWSRYTTIVSWE